MVMLTGFEFINSDIALKAQSTYNTSHTLMWYSPGHAVNTTD